MGPSSKDQSLPQLIAAAEAGGRDAQDSLGMLHELGLIPGASIKEALVWYGKGVKAGDPQAAFALARLQEQSAKSDAEKKMISALFQMAAKQGFRQPHQRLEEVFQPNHGRTVLLVDAQETFRLATRKLLEARGFTVALAADAASALRIVENGHPCDLILTDITLPDMDGVEMLQLIRKRYLKVDLPVIILTNSRDIEQMKRAKSFGLLGWILKPFDVDKLTQTITKAFESARAA